MKKTLEALSALLMILLVVNFETALSNIKYKVLKTGLVVTIIAMTIPSALSFSSSEYTISYKGEKYELREFKKLLVESVEPQFRAHAEMLVGDVLVNSIKRDIDPVLIMALIRQESAFNPTAKHPKTGAFGPMQVMDRTIGDINTRILKNTKKLSRYDYSQNIEAGVTYLDYLLKKFNYDVKKALIAYNSGPGYVLSLPFDYEYNHDYYNKIEKYYYVFSDKIKKNSKNYKNIPSRRIASIN